jgi:hypothetical protein
MALPTPAPRKLSHTRTAVYTGYEREDGLWDIEASLTDIKPYDYIIPGQEERMAGKPIHGLNIRLTVDSHYIIQEVMSDMAHIPHPECIQADGGMHKLVGCKLGAGWRKAIATHIGGVEGCTHLREMLFNMATAAFQTISSAQQFNRHQAGLPPAIPDSPPPHLGQCMSWAFDGPATQRYYPMFFRKGDAKE